MRLYGKNSVLERLKSKPKSIQRIYIEDGHLEGSYIRQKAKQWGIPVCSVPSSKIQKLTRAINAQGILMEVEEFRYVPFAELLGEALKRNHTLVLLDGINDPQNLGVMVRSLACLGKFSIVLPTHGSVGVTEAVLRVACGGDNYVPIARVSNLNQAIATAKKAGFWIAGAVVTEGEDLRKVQLPFPLALVMGSEQKGIREILRKQLDKALTIPMQHQRLSLNVAQAATIFCYEIARQRK
jgi:23S rRNA (guanosine2251-2'-O)-methyltransferase